MKKIRHFALTGGPCGGKTDGLEIISESLRKKGYKVLIMPETATELHNAGILLNDYETAVYQKILIDRSIVKEETLRKAANYLPQDVVILYDRGLIDAKAYMKAEDFEEDLKTHGLDEKEVRSRYTAVFHLVTAANGAEEAYLKAMNNSARLETPEQARKRDIDTLNVWKGQKNHHIIDNSTDFEGKMERLLDAVLSYLDE